MTPNLSFPLFALFGATRGLGGIGAGMLLADHLSKPRRKLLGKILFGVGVASTLPLLIAVVRRSRRREEPAGVMDPMTTVYQPEHGVISDAEIETPLQAEMPNLRR
ncbi:MAG TPA: hypothetical protein VIV11_21035 [Kofleriaceae bacterium]